MPLIGVKFQFEMNKEIKSAPEKMENVIELSNYWF